MTPACRAPRSVRLWASPRAERRNSSLLSSKKFDLKNHTGIMSMTIDSNLTLEIYKGYALDEFDRWDAIIHPDVQAQSKGITANAKKESRGFCEVRGADLRALRERTSSKPD